MHYILLNPHLIFNKEINMDTLTKRFASFVPDQVRKKTKNSLQRLAYGALAKVSGGKEGALRWSYSQFELTPLLLVQSFCQGMYPMPNMKNNSIIECYDPEVRGIIPIKEFRLTKNLLRLLKKEPSNAPDERFKVKINTNFKETIRCCAKPRGTKTKTWLTAEYIAVAEELYEMGIMHSIETYKNGSLVGGVIGMAVNGCFVSLSMFYTVDNASKIAFYYLLVKLKEDGFLLHVSGDADSWFIQYGLVNMDKTEFRKQLIPAITAPVKFTNRVPELVF